MGAAVGTHNKKTKEVIHIAIYHLSVQIISRSEGRSSIAAAAYRSGTKIDSSWDGLTYDFTRKNWIEHTEVLLPAHAPKSFKDRSVLWNAVEQAEKSGNAQLAREVEIALPAELSLPKQIELIRSYVDHEFVSRGMCADISIHNPPRTNEHGVPVDCEGNKTKDRSRMIFQNPHAHIMLTMRALDKNGKWQPKSERAYICKKDQETLTIPASKMKEAEVQGWEKLYNFQVGRQKIKLTEAEGAERGLKKVSRYAASVKIESQLSKDWNSPETLKQWRESWAYHCNQALEAEGLSVRIDHRSFEEQGILQLPTTHMGVHAYHMEKKGIKTDRGDMNRKIKEDNRFLQQIEKRIKQLEEKERRYLMKVVAKLEGSRARFIVAAYQQISLALQVATEEERIQKQMMKASAMARASEQMIKGIEALTETLTHLQEELKHTNPVQMKRKQELEKKILETEHEIAKLKSQMKEVKMAYEQKKKGPGMNLDAVEQTKTQIQSLKRKQSQIYNEFQDLVQENRMNLVRLQEMMGLKRTYYDDYIEKKLREHYKEKFDADALAKARQKAPDLQAGKEEHLTKNKSKKILTSCARFF